MKKTLVYLEKYRKECILAPLLKMLEASFELVVPLLIAGLIDTGIGGGNVPYIWKMCGLLVLFCALGLCASVTAQYFSAKAATGFATDVRHALFEHIQSLRFSDMDGQGVSALITRMTSDINQAQSGVNMTLRLFLRSPFIVFGAMIMAFTVDVKGGLIFAVVIPLLSIVVFTVMAISIPLYKKVQAGLDRVLGRTRENLTGIRVIRAFRREKKEIEGFEQENGALTNLQILVGRISAVTNPVTYVLINAALILLLYTGALRVDSGILTGGQVVALVNYMSQILVELIKLANLIVTITKAVACGGRIGAVLEIEPGKAEAQMRKEESPRTENMSASSSYLAFDHVSLTYTGASEETLSDISFSVEKGQTIGIIGGTGSGKTSLISLIPGYYDATAGGVYLEGKDVRDMNKTELRKKVSVVLQKAVLFKGSIEYNLRWGNPDATEEDLQRALRISQSAEFVGSKEGGMQYLLEQGGKNLSGGQRQRLTIARALVGNPEILILDDSCSALDFATDAALRKALKEETRGMTLFMISQRFSTVMNADRILVLDDGQTAGFGTHEELLESCPVYREIVQSQGGV